MLKCHFTDTMRAGVTGDERAGAERRRTYNMISGFHTADVFIDNMQMWTAEIALRELTVQWEV